MQNTGRAFIALSALVLVIGAATRPAAQQSGPTQPQQPTSVRGELLSVDAVAKTLTIRTVDQNEMEFQYTERTEVTGAKEGAAGLATRQRGRVTVHFTRVGQVNVATKIEVHPELKLA